MRARLDRRSSWIVWTLPLLLCARGAVAWAQPVEGDPRKAAEALAEQGQDLLIQNKPLEALRILKQADETLHSPAIVLLIARCHMQAGRPEEAYEAYQSVINEQLPSDAPAAFIDAQRLARSEILTVEAELAFVTLDPAGEDVTSVSVDERSVPEERWSKFPVRPGRHTIALVSEDRSARVPIELRRGEKRKLVFPPAEGKPSVPTPKRDPLLLYGSLGAFGFAAVGFAAGIGLAVRAGDLADELAPYCIGERCLVNASALLDEAWSTADGATASLVLASLATAAGGTMLGLYFTGFNVQSAVGMRLTPTGLALDVSF